MAFGKHNTAPGSRVTAYYRKDITQVLGFAFLFTLKSLPRQVCGIYVYMKDNFVRCFHKITQLYYSEHIFYLQCFVRHKIGQFHPFYAKPIIRLLRKVYRTTFIAVIYSTDHFFLNTSINNKLSTATFAHMMTKDCHSGVSTPPTVK